MTRASFLFCYLLAFAALTASAAEPERLNGALLPTETAQSVLADGRSIWIVQLRSPGAMARAMPARSGNALAQKAAPDGLRFDRKNSAVAGAASAIADEQGRLLVRAGVQAEVLHSYRFALNGFAAKMTAIDAARLRALPAVAEVYADHERRVATNASPNFLGLFDREDGLISAKGLSGEGVTIGIIDSGITPDSVSFEDTRPADSPRACRSSWGQNSLLGRWLCRSYRRKAAVALFEPPEDWAGACIAGEAFADTDCNNKLIGARYYSAGSAAVGDFDSGEFLSARDADGHGTHIASTAAGNRVDATINGSRVATIRGIAPGARIAAYKACWLRPGATRATCAVSDLVQAIDDAVADGVDIINYSIGNLDPTVSNADDVALLNATKAGVLAVVAAGNDGPMLGTIGSPAGSPWALSVAASSRDGGRFVEATEVTAPARLAARYASREADFTPALREVGSVSGTLIAADDDDTAVDIPSNAGTITDACQALVNADEMDGNIAFVRRGGCDFDVKVTNAQNAGATAVMVFSNFGAPIRMLGDSTDISIPAVMIGQADGQLLLDALNENETITVTLANGLFLTEAEQANVVGNFSSRGPSSGAPSILKPDVSAPGVNILAAISPDVANGTSGQRFGYLTGTSMAAPHVAGAAALLREANPEWTPSMLRSALMTSARQDLTQDDGVTAANPFDRGAGHIQPNLAAEPGLVYATSDDEYDAFTCAVEGFPIDSDRCEQLRSSGLDDDPSALNQPAIAVARLTQGKTIRRTVTATEDGTWQAQLFLPEGFTGSVTPASLTLSRGQSASFDVAIASTGSNPDFWYFGALEWSGDERTVRSPIAFRPVLIDAPDEVSGAGGTSNVDFPVRFGYTGDYTATLFGLNAATVTNDVVANDPSRSFSRRTSNGVTAFSLNVPVNQLYLRLSLFNTDTDGDDDLDLYVYYCPTPERCELVGESTGETSDEQVDIAGPTAGRYEVFVHGFETDELAGGSGTAFALSTWLIGNADQPGNAAVDAPSFVGAGGTETLVARWQNLPIDQRYLGLIVHSTADGPTALTVLRVTN